MSIASFLPNPARASSIVPNFVGSTEEKGNQGTVRNTVDLNNSLQRPMTNGCVVLCGVNQKATLWIRMNRLKCSHQLKIGTIDSIDHQQTRRNYTTARDLTWND